MQQITDGHPCVITDANILINFIKIGHLDILQQLQMYVFYLPEEVYREITYPAQRTVLDQALNAGWLKKTTITDLNELRLYAQYKRQMGDGEAACLAIAICRKWILACDEQKKRMISREIQGKLGDGYLLNTPGILLKAIRENILTIEQADEIKNELAQNRFVLKIKSFRDLL